MIMMIMMIENPLQAFGVKVNCKYHQSDLMSAVSIDQQERQSAFLHPFDDVNVILGHARYVWCLKIFPLLAQ